MCIRDRDFPRGRTGPEATLLHRVLFIDYPKCGAHGEATLRRYRIASMQRSGLVPGRVGHYHDHEHPPHKEVG
eukprot:15387293-Alexandrium_andersonii.AAC.1